MTRRSLMLNHPTLDQIHQLGLAGMARAFTELHANPETPASVTPNGSAFCSTARSPSDVTSG